MVIRPSENADFPQVLSIINDAARAYRGVIPDDRWHEPYMSGEQLEREITDGVAFWIAEEDGRVLGVMGIQDRGDVALMRHAYVESATQRKGVGRALLHHVASLASTPILIGTWAAASWAIDFYQRNGFTLVPDREKDDLLRRYWSIPERQIETSVVLADPRWRRSREGLSTPSSLT
jgi:N-acetylglutamate synthase-like GNAT family acetyltransferase